MCMGADSSKSDGGMSEAHKSMSGKPLSSGGGVTSRSSNPGQGLNSSDPRKSLLGASKSSVRVGKNVGGKPGASSGSPVKRSRKVAVRSTIASLLSLSPTVRMFKHFSGTK